MTNVNVFQNNFEPTTVNCWTYVTVSVGNFYRVINRTTVCLCACGVNLGLSKVVRFSPSKSLSFSRLTLALLIWSRRVQVSLLLTSTGIPWATGRFIVRTRCEKSYWKRTWSNIFIGPKTKTPSSSICYRSVKIGSRMIKTKEMI